MAGEDRSLYGVFGATGFTGQRVVNELLTVLPAGTPLVISGRSQQKLQGIVTAMREKHGEEAIAGLLPVVADVSNPSSLEALASMVQCLINCVGPFRFYGEPVVKAAIAGGCHYVDITGEPEFMESSVLKYHAAAEKAGLRIVHGCGMDSVPADVVTRHGARRFTAAFPGGVPTQVDHFWSVSGNGQGVAVHYGTWHSLIHSMTNAAALRATRKLAKSQNPQPKVQYTGKKQVRQSGPYFDAGLGKWALPFPGADASVVRRTQQHLTAHPGAGGFPPEHALQYAVYFLVPEWYHMVLFVVFGALLQLLVSFDAGCALLLQYPSFFSMGVFSHEGPTPAQMQATTFDCTFRVKGYAQPPPTTSPPPPDCGLVVTMRGPEPGYISTSAMVVASARALVEGEGTYPAPDSGTTGVLTPGDALNYPPVMDKLLARLHQRGITVEEAPL